MGTQSGGTDRASAKTATLSETNQRILRVACDSFTHGQEWESKPEEWEFFCECGRVDCHEYVSLTLDAYIALHDSGRSVLAEGHRLSQSERARRLRTDAEALMHQAEHQLKRARKNLRDCSTPRG